MRIYLTILILATCALLSSCAKKVFKSKSDTKKTERKEQVYTDTSRVESIYNVERIEHYGDTLNASMYFDDEIVIDSIESIGIKVKAELIPAGRGYKVKVEATSRPVSTSEKKSFKQSDHSAIQKQSLTVTDSTSTAEQVDKEVEPSVGLRLTWIYIIMALVIAYIIYRVYKKLKPF